MKVKMNTQIYTVLIMVYHYAQYKYAMAKMYPEKNIDWYKDTEEFYFSLDLPEGLNKDKVDFEKVLNFNFDSEPFKKWANTEIHMLEEFIWEK